MVSIQEWVIVARVRYLIWFFQVHLPEEKNKKYSKFEIRHVQIPVTEIFVLFNFFSANATKTEVIDLGGEGTICDEHAKFPVATSAAVGALMEGKWPLICGGTSSESDCYFFNNQTGASGMQSAGSKIQYS